MEKEGREREEKVVNYLSYHWRSRGRRLRSRNIWTLWKRRVRTKAENFSYPPRIPAWHESILTPQSADLRFWRLEQKNYVTAEKGFTSQDYKGFLHGLLRRTGPTMVPSYISGTSPQTCTLN
ncbi:hypothetical protein Salat_2885100 [Sesamum alatum]|uniref:Uncharacterized protein n=1 Tax=Sesamum alatum TaxID=300844 RepID=A0AAE2C7Y7_9LAMI|nr:hypothetical protein Salat_2885100 [Sesamum alatum]